LVYISSFGNLHQEKSGNPGRPVLFAQIGSIASGSVLVFFTKGFRATNDGKFRSEPNKNFQMVQVDFWSYWQIGHLLSGEWNWLIS
jgi:hypothetical protein